MSDTVKPLHPNDLADHELFGWHEFLELPDQCKLLYTYLRALHGGQRWTQMFGIFHISAETMQRDLRWSSAEYVRSQLAFLSERQFIRFCERTDWLWLISPDDDIFSERDSDLIEHTRAIPQSCSILEEYIQGVISMPSGLSLETKEALKQLIPADTEPVVTDAFDQFWTVWHSHTKERGKTKAKGVWREDEQYNIENLPVILDGVQREVDYCAKAGIDMPEAWRWLRLKRWSEWNQVALEKTSVDWISIGLKLGVVWAVERTYPDFLEMVKAAYRSRQ